jgi:hypothetical protein
MSRCVANEEENPREKFWNDKKKSLPLHRQNKGTTPCETKRIINDKYIYNMIRMYSLVCGLSYLRIQAQLQAKKEKKNK